MTTSLQPHAAPWHSLTNRVVGQRIVAIDEALLLRVARRRVPALTWLMRALTRLADPLGGGLAALCAVAWVGGTPRWLWPATLASLLALAVVNVLKRWLRRPRPNVAILGFRAVANNPDAFAFPSGHTAAAFAVWVTVGWQYPVHAGPLALLACGVGLSRVYLGAHYPLDVVVGALLGSLSALFIVL